MNSSSILFTPATCYEYPNSPKSCGRDKKRAEYHCRICDGLCGEAKQGEECDVGSECYIYHPSPAPSALLGFLLWVFGCRVAALGDQAGLFFRQFAYDLGEKSVWFNTLTIIGDEAINSIQPELTRRFSLHAIPIQIGSSESFSDRGNFDPSATDLSVRIGIVDRGFNFVLHLNAFSSLILVHRNMERGAA